MFGRTTVYIHKDKLDCALKLLEKGSSLKDIAKSCHLSLSQVSEIARQHSYYVDTRKYLEELMSQKRRLTREVKELEREREKLTKEIERLKLLKDGLDREVKKDMELIDGIIASLDVLCSHIGMYDEELRKNVREFEKMIGKSLKDFVIEIEELTDPGLINDINEVEKTIEGYGIISHERELIKEKLENIKSALYNLQPLLAVKGPIAKLMAVVILSSACNSVEELKRLRQRVRAQQGSKITYGYT